MMEPSIVNFLCLLHQLSDTIHAAIIHWLVISRCLTDCLEVEDVCLWLVLSLINEDLVSKFLDFNIPRVIGLGGAHQDSSDLVSCEDVCGILFDELNHDWIFEDRLIKGMSFVGFENLWLFS